MGFGEHLFTRTVHFWINEILMVVFFFVVGLEVRRELFEGELSTPRRAALPVAAALGGMLVPAAIYVSFNAGSPAVRGWGVPMATDIAFAVGVRNPLLYVAPGIVVWVGMLQAGIHPTIAGVILGLLTPVRSWFGHQGFVVETERALDRLRSMAARERDPRKLLPVLERINIARREAVPPVTRIEAALHPWVAFGIMPLFALANAGVALGGLGDGSAEATGIALGVGLGLVLGKPLGVVIFSWLAVRTGLALLPRGVSWAGVLVVGCVAGIGFTMSLFIGALAFSDASMLAIAKLAVLAASAFAGVVGLVVGYRFLPRGPSADVVGTTPDEAERSTIY